MNKQAEKIFEKYKHWGTQAFNVSASCDFDFKKEMFPSIEYLGVRYMIDKGKLLSFELLQLIHNGMAIDLEKGQPPVVRKPNTDNVGAWVKWNENILINIKK